MKKASKKKSKPKYYWTKERCAKEALKYDTRGSFQKQNRSAYRASLKNGWLDYVCRHMKQVRRPKYYWTDERIRAEALKYTTKQQFYTNSATAYYVAVQKGVLDAICSHMITVKKGDDFLFKSYKTHGHKYDYSLVEYVRHDIKVNIVCRQHGVFKQSPSMHVSGNGCPKCGLESIRKIHSMGLDEFVRRSNDIHANKYDYSLVIYENSSTKVNIICPKHGVFSQMPVQHLHQKQGCAKCKSSRGEKKVMDLLSQYGVKFHTQKTFSKCKDKGLLRFDFYLPKYNLCIEYQGRQHYMVMSNNFFGGDAALADRKRRDEIKREFCKSNNIGLLEIGYFDFKNIESILIEGLKLTSTTAIINNQNRTVQLDLFTSHVA